MATTPGQVAADIREDQRITDIPGVIAIKVQLHGIGVERAVVLAIHDAIVVLIEQTRRPLAGFNAELTVNAAEQITALEAEGHAVFVVREQFGELARLAVINDAISTPAIAVPITITITVPITITITVPVAITIAIAITVPVTITVTVTCRFT
jgi:hypothetical protein